MKTFITLITVLLVAASGISQKEYQAFKGHFELGVKHRTMVYDEFPGLITDELFTWNESQIVIPEMSYILTRPNSFGVSIHIGLLKRKTEKDIENGFIAAAQDEFGANNFYAINWSENTFWRGYGLDFAVGANYTWSFNKLEFSPTAKAGFFVQTGQSASLIIKEEGTNNYESYNIANRGNLVMLYLNTSARLFYPINDFLGLSYELGADFFNPDSFDIDTQRSNFELQGFRRETLDYSTGGISVMNKFGLVFYFKA